MPKSQLRHVNQYGDIVAKPARKRNPQRIKHPTVGRVTEPVVVIRANGLSAVRLLRHITEDASITVSGKPITQAFEVYLDGSAVLRQYHDGRIIKEEEEVITTMEAISAARTKDVIDYGRFQQSCLALTRIVDNIKEEGSDPSPEQQESVLRSYQGLLEWRADLAQKINLIDGALDIAAAKARSVLL